MSEYFMYMCTLVSCLVLYVHVHSVVMSGYFMYMCTLVACLGAVRVCAFWHQGVDTLCTFPSSMATLSIYALRRQVWTLLCIHALWHQVWILLCTSALSSNKSGLLCAHLLSGTRLPWSIFYTCLSKEQKIAAANTKSWQYRSNIHRTYETVLDIHHVGVSLTCLPILSRQEKKQLHLSHIFLVILCGFFFLIQF